MTEIKKLPDRYDAKTREKYWQKYWSDKKIYKWLNDKPKSETFVIDTPPPTVSGLLHMGHVFSYTQADFVARFMRMSGKDVFYPMGFDDNGLPTERLVEKIIGKKAGVFESENGHGSFVNKCREVVDEAEKEFEALFNEIALSVDWEQKYQTISPESQKISQASFVDLHRKGLVEKKFEPVFWDISDRTALAQADLVDKEVEGVMNEIEFSIENSDEKIIIMTTRPELLPACVAVMVHPEDVRYKNLHGKNAITPLFGVKVKIIPDDLVQLDKGTGAVMCCTFGDETDIRWWKKHNLELRVIFGESGRTNWPSLSKIITENLDAPCLDEMLAKFHESEKGRSIKEAKDFVIAELKSQNLLLKQDSIKRAVKCAERSGVPIEILVASQWFVKILDKKELLKAKAAECNWYPQYMKVRIDQWIDGLSWDWCISRQRFFGVKFPVWYVKKPHDLGIGDPVVADIDQLPVDPMKTGPKGYENYRSVATDGKIHYYKATKDGQEYNIIPETDIMDTWATSSISPQLSSKGISDEISFDKTRHEKLFPADMRPQAHEIIRTWAFYTLVKSTLHQNSVPWKNLMISGWCLAADKTKMSKSKGNVVTPTALIEEKGSDIVRYWASTSHLGADTAYSEEVFKIGQKLITKLFNAAKFASMNFEVLDVGATLAVARGQAQGLPLQGISEASDLWVLSKLYATVERATSEFEKFEYARAREAIEEFFWKDFCDNYLEICKVRSYGLAAEKLAGVELNDAQKSEVQAKQQSAILTLRICLNTILKLFAPFIPHVCDEIYSTIFADEFEKIGSINSRGNWPKLGEEFFNQKFHDIGEAALAVIFEVRKFKSDNNLSMKTTVKKILVNCEKDLSEIAEDLRNVCNAEEIEFIKGEKFSVEIML
jgi:valyl-tRNA synthetase